MNRIEEYRFGSIRVGGRDYGSDVIVFEDRVMEGWWRRSGHSLCPEDLGEVIAAGVNLLVVGTGYSGAMAVPGETVRWLEGHGIEVRSMPTTQAVRQFNELLDRPEDRPIAAALHLTC